MAGGHHPGELKNQLSGERSPGFDTILKVMDALGLKLHTAAASRS